MKEYKKIINFYYRNKKYQLLLDDDNKYFFLEINSNNNYSYVTIDNFINLCKIFCSYPDKKYIINDNINNNKIKVIPKVVVKGIATLLTVTTLASYGIKNNNEISEIETVDDSYTVSETVNIDENRYILDNVSLVVDDIDDELIVDTYLNNQYTSSIYIHDMDILDNYLDYDSVSMDELLITVKNNETINEKFKPYLYEFINSMCLKYPNCDMRMFYENIKTLKIIECNDEVMFEKTGSRTADACYITNKNEIYAKENSV